MKLRLHKQCTISNASLILNIIIATHLEGMIAPSVHAEKRMTNSSKKNIVLQHCRQEYLLCKTSTQFETWSSGSTRVIMMQKE